MKHLFSNRSRRIGFAALERLAPRLVLTTYGLVNNPVLDALDAEVLIDEAGQGTVLIDLEARKVPSSQTFYVDERFDGNGSAANPFADLPDAFARIDDLGLSNATIRVGAGDYTWGDILRPDPSEGGTSSKPV
jgi:hypothetical protein